MTEKNTTCWPASIGPFKPPDAFSWLHNCTSGGGETGGEPELPAPLPLPRILCRSTTTTRAVLKSRSVYPQQANLGTSSFYKQSTLLAQSSRELKIPA